MTPAKALWLLCRVRWVRTGGSVSASPGSWDGVGRGGDGWEDTSSALPSKESDNRTWEDDGGGRMEVGELRDVGLTEHWKECLLLLC